MKLDEISKIVESVKQAELVLVGIGEEWQVTEDEMKLNKEYMSYTQKINDLTTESDKISFAKYFYYQNDMPERLKKAYKALYDLIKDKNYFIVSMTMDSYLQKMGFKEDRFVNPCGNFELLQCAEGCSEEFVPAAMHEQKMKAYLTGESEFMYCSSCNQPLVINNLYANHYLEKGYTDKWQIYMKWLQGTLNKKLTILELGVGMKYPTVIRWPFEKTAFFNQKSEFFRINKKLPMLAENMADRGYFLDEDSVELISTCKIDGISL